MAVLYPKNKFPLRMNNEAITNKFECVGKMTSCIALRVLCLWENCLDADNNIVYLDTTIDYVINALS